MPRTSKADQEIRVLLAVMPKKEWQRAILEKLDLHPLTLNDLAEKFNIKAETTQYSDLMILVSSLQEARPRGLDPRVKAAYFKNDKGEVVYPLYRTDQEGDLVQKGILPSEEVQTDLISAARELGIKPNQVALYIHNKER